MTPDDVAPGGAGPHDPVMETRVTRLAEDMRDVKATLGRFEAILIRIDTLLQATLPNLVTKAEFADFKSEMRNEFTSFKAEARGELVASKAETTAGLANVRVELIETKTELEVGLANCRIETADLRTEVRASLAGLPSKTYLWGILGVPLTAYACGLAALAVLR